MERDDRAGRIQDILTERVLNTEVSAEVTIPDYKPELRRLLRVRATALPTDRYIGAGTAEVSGPVELEALYAADDGSLWCVCERTEYRFSMPFERGEDFSAAEGILCEVFPETEAAVGRVSAPRRLTLRCRVRARVCLYAVRELNARFDAERESSEVLCGELTAVHRFFGESAPVRLSDEVIPEVPEVRVICARADVFPGEAQTGSGSVRCRGEVCLNLLCAAETPGEESGTAPVFTVQRRIPFAEDVPVDGVEVNCLCAFTGICTEVSVTVEDGRILCETTCVLSAHAVRNETVAYLKDAYSTARESESACRTDEASGVVCCRNGNFSLTANLTLSQAGIPKDGEAADATATVTLSQAEAIRGNWTIPGTARIRVLVRSGNEWTTAEMEIPFRYEIPDAGAADERVVSEAEAVPVSVRTRIDGERVSVEAELGMTVLLRNVREYSVLASVREGAPVARQGAVCTVCYPGSGDTLWSVAKRYRVPVNAIGQRNRLPDSPAADAPDSLAGVRFLIL